MAKYKDWRKFDPLTMQNEQIRNTPETARGGYSAVDPLATPDWARRTPTEQARVNAAQAKAQAETTTQGYSALAPATAPVSVPTTGNAPSFANLDNASKATMKRNNPALYNQLLVQGIISPLAEDQKQTATAPATVQKTETVPNVGAVSPTTGETEATGYAKYLAQNPELAEADRRAEEEYARALPTYGALAERMAQEGIHGGYSDYLQGVAYAKMQDAKANSFADYVAQQETTTKEKQAQNGAMYDLFGRSEYTDSEGNTAQGYGLLTIANDEDYAKAVETARADALNRGADSSAVDEALKKVDAMRKLYKDQVSASATDALKNYNAGKLEPAQLFGTLGYTPSEGESEGVALLSALDSAVDNGMISPEQRSETLKNGLSLYSDKPSAKDVLKSIKTAIDLNDEGTMTDKDKNAVLEDALKAVETYFKGKKWTVKIENGKLYAKNKAGEWEDLGNLKYKSEFETIFRGSYYDDVVKLVYENRNKK